MEYVISTREFDEAEKKGDLFIYGGYYESHEAISILEGEILNESSIRNTQIEAIFSAEYIGNYNYIRYDFLKKKIFIKNDKLGTYPVFIFNDGKTIIISNNVWRIIKLLKSEELEISEQYFKFILGSWGVNLDGKTLFKNVTEINAGHNVEIDVRNCSTDYKQYYSLQQNKDEVFTLEEAVNQLDTDLSYTFARMKEENPDKILGFGNSGGLDSRLVPIYSSQYRIKSIGISIVNKKPNKILDSITAVNAEKIAKAYNIPNFFLSHIVKKHDERMLLDIRNNPFGPSNILKNPYYDVPKIDYYVTGGNGFIVGGAWQKFINIKSDKDLRDNFLDYHSKLNAYKWNNSDGRLINILFSKEEKDDIVNQKYRFFEENKHKDPLSLVRSFHQFSMNKRSPAGGFESMNRLYKTYNIYYPIVFENTLKWNPEFFPGRLVLKNLIKKKSDLLYNIPSQSYNRLDGKPLNFKGKVIRRLANQFRDMGLDYGSWVYQKEFINYSNEVFSRDNDLYYDLLGISKEEFMKLEVIYNYVPHVSLDFLKLKRILDIIVYKEFNFVNIAEFELK